ncbi:MAG TPA: hypothetical protein VFQ61_28705 [Polyangiaceae bacterium]|nr:hypothetical protein [Polyangiaceae bacterium]
MTATKKAKKKQSAPKRERRERRFTAEPTYASRVTAFAGMGGALVLGAGVYAQWIRDEALSYAPVLVASGAAVLAWALWKSGGPLANVRVGEAGVALEKDNELNRLLWCDIERIALDKSDLLIRGKNAQLRFPLDAHQRAAAWIVSEAGQRVPDVVALSRAEIERLPQTKDSDGELVNIEDVQVAGRHCKATGKPISFEREARLCPTCGEAYLKDHVPKKCLTCNAELGSRAREV